MGTKPTTRPVQRKVDRRAMIGDDVVLISEGQCFDELVLRIYKS